MPPVDAPPALRSGADGPWKGLTPVYAGKLAMAIVCFGAGMHYLSSGRKEANLNKIITGAVLSLLSLALLL